MIRVLIVEDDPMVAELNKNYLALIDGFALVGIASNGQEAIDFLHNHDISLVLLDVFMPKIDGLSLLQTIRKDFPKIDAIMVTAARNSEEVQQALRFGVVDYLVKPFTFNRFQSALISYKERTRLLRSSESINQDIIDKRIFAQTTHSQLLPKGIDTDTLNAVRKVVSTFTESFSVKNILPLTQLSRISLKKYLDHLHESGELGSNLVYSAIGRPHRVYICTNVLKSE